MVEIEINWSNNYSQESGLDADHYAEDDDDEEENVQPQAATNSNIPPPQPTN